MFAIEKVLSQVQSTGSSWENVEEIGTLKEGLKKTHQLGFSNKNLEGSNRVTVFVYDTTKPDNAPFMVSCSKRLSEIVRKALKNSVSKAQLLAMLIDLRLVKNESGTFIVPTGQQAERFSLAAIGNEEPVTFEELLVL